MIEEINVEKALDYIRNHAEEMAKAKAQRVYLEQFRKSKKAILFGECDEKTIADRENWAYAHPEYIEIIECLREAIEQEEKLKWMMSAALTKVEVWRSQQANNRMIDKFHA